MVTEQQIREYDCEMGFREIENLRSSYARFVIGLKRQIFTGGRSQLSQMVGSLEMSHEAIHGIEESTRRWAGGGTYYATVSNDVGEPLLRLKYEIQGAPVPYRGPGSDGYVDDGADPGVTHLPTKNRAQRAADRQNQNPVVATEPVQLLDKALHQSAQQAREEATRRERELLDLRRQLEEQRNAHTALLERSARERADADSRTTQSRIEALQEELRSLRNQPPPAPTRGIDWAGVAALAAPLVPLATAIITAGTERQRMIMTQQPQTQPQRSLLGELKEVLAIPGVSKIADKLLSGGGSGEDKIALVDAMAEAQLAHISMFRDVMRELEPKGDPVAVQVTRMIAEGLDRIGQVIERARSGGGAPALQQQTQQQQPTQSQENQEHVAEVVEQDPAVQELQAAFDKFPPWMKTQDWAMLLQECFKADRNVIQSDQIDMVAAVVVQLVDQAVKAGAVDKAMAAPSEEALTEIAGLLMPYSEDHATALFRALTRVFAVNKTAPGPSVVQPRAQERVGGPGEVVPFRR